MEELLVQIEKALKNELYLLALQSTLTLPDICARLLKDDNVKKEDYMKWYKENINDKQGLSGENCYYFRCAMLHEGKMEHKNLEFSKIIFVKPNSGMVIKGSTISMNEEKVLIIDVIDFCYEMIKQVKKWWQENKNEEIVKRNYQNIVRYYPNGLPPYIMGVTVIG